MSRRIVMLLAFVVVMTACGDMEGGLTISDPWGRPSPAMAQAVAFYMEITNPGSTEDTLVSATSPVCDTVELHQSVLDDNQVMMMSQLEDGIDIAGDATVMLEPGGMHIMCIGLDHELETGEMIKVQLRFAIAESRDIEVEIREN